MALKTITYTSFASLDLTVGDLEAVHQTSRNQNAIHDVTGLLVFNGTRFLQVIEGGTSAIEALIENIRRDWRHSGLEIRDDRPIEKRCFPHWRMELVRVSAGYFEARQTISDRLPPNLDEAIRKRLLLMTEGISGIMKF